MVKRCDTWLETLSLSDSFDDLVGLVAFLEWVTAEQLPMIEDTLWESSS